MHVLRAAVTAPSGHVLLINRDANQSEAAARHDSRAFDSEHARRLATHIAAVTQRSVLLFGKANLSALDTLRAFARASAVVGYHGVRAFTANQIEPTTPKHDLARARSLRHAERVTMPWASLALRLLYTSAVTHAQAALSNVVFATGPVCVVEISTLMRDDAATVQWCAKNRTIPVKRYRGQGAPGAVFQPWRSNRDIVSPWQPMARWQNYYLPANALLEVNGQATRVCNNDTPAFINTWTREFALYKNLPRVELQNHDSFNVATAVENCLRTQTVTDWGNPLASAPGPTDEREAGSPQPPRDVKLGPESGLAMARPGNGSRLSWMAPLFLSVLRR